jgi:hypothetical protein
MAHADTGSSNPEGGGATTAVSLKAKDHVSQSCPICHTSIVTRIEMFSISSKLLDRAVSIRKEMDSNKIKDKSSKTNHDGSSSMGKSEAKLSTSTSNIPEASYLMMSSTYDPTEDVLPSSPLWEADFQRIGRWSKEEADYVDFLSKAFEEGQLTLPKSTRLKDFLCKMLLCKGSRITKRYKNAKLSMKTYEMKPPTVNNGYKCTELSILQDRFLNSINSEAGGLELRFNISFTWNLMFSRFCTEIGYGGIDFRKWNISLELMEQRATEVEETIRAFRRKNVELTLARSDNNSNVHDNVVVPISHKRPSHSIGENNNTSNKTHHAAVLSKPFLPPRMLDPIQPMTPPRIQLQPLQQQYPQPDVSVSHTGHSYASRSTMNDFAGVFNDANEQLSQKNYISQRHTSASGCVSLLRRFISFMETNNLPFHCADVWVLSTGPPPDSSARSIVSSLYNGGYATRTDLDSTIINQLDQFGEYSSKFLFDQQGKALSRMCKSKTNKYSPSLTRIMCSNQRS